MKILDREAGPGYRPYLIAEMSGNHKQSRDRALGAAQSDSALCL